MKTAEADAEILQAAIIAGHLQPKENAAALAALQRQSLTNIRLLTIVGDDKFITRKEFTRELAPWKWGASALGGSVITIAGALIIGGLT